MGMFVHLVLDLAKLHLSLMDLPAPDLKGVVFWREYMGLPDPPSSLTIWKSE